LQKSNGLVGIYYTGITNVYINSLAFVGTIQFEFNETQEEWRLQWTPFVIADLLQPSQKHRLPPPCEAQNNVLPRETLEQSGTEH